MLRILDDRSKRFGLKINTGKTKVMVFERRASTNASHLDLGKTDVEEFVYLGSLFNKTNDCKPDIRSCINLANQAFGRLQMVWQAGGLNVKQNKFWKHVYSRVSCMQPKHGH